MKIMYYIKKANKPIEAILLEDNRQSIEVVTKFLQNGELNNKPSNSEKEAWERYLSYVSKDGGIFLKTPESNGETQLASFGDFIVKAYSEKLGWHFYPVKPDYFYDNYDLLDNNLSDLVKAKTDRISNLKSKLKINWNSLCDDDKALLINICER
jgi:hypothetical protein